MRAILVLVVSHSCAAPGAGLNTEILGGMCHSRRLSGLPTCGFGGVVRHELLVEVD
jgi:hypothetical protein